MVTGCKELQLVYIRMEQILQVQTRMRGSIFLIFMGVNMEKKRLVVSLAAALPLFTVAAAASAQSVDSNYELKGTSISGSSASKSTTPIFTAVVDPDIAPIKTESGLYLYPSVFTGAGYNSNINSSATAPTSSSYLLVAPQLTAEMKNNGDRYTAVLSADSTSFQSSSADNVTNSKLALAGDNYLDSRARLGWSVSSIGGNDARGSTQNNSNTPEAWRNNGLNGRFIYGAPEAAGRLEFDLGTSAKTYDHYALGDLTANNVAGRGFYRVGARTFALLEVSQTKTAYKSALSNDSNTERKYYAGLTWEATAVTTGIVKVGRQTKDFDVAGKDGFSGGSWEATARWTPLTYSVFDLQTSKAAYDSTGLGNYELKTNTALNWKHKWTQSIGTSATIGTLVTEFGGATNGRIDTANSYSVGVNYSLRRWLKLGFDFTATDNTSNISTAAYKRNISMFTLNASL
jgi:hypothetical protein